MTLTFRLALAAALLGATAGCGQGPDALLAKAREEIALGHWHEARAHVLEALEKRPGDAAMLAVLVDANLQLGDVEGAQRAFGRLRRAGGHAGDNRRDAEIALLRGDPALALTRLGEDRSADGWRLRAQALLAQGDRAGARAAFESGMADPRNMRLLTAYARFALLEGDLPQAARLLAGMKAVSAGAYETLALAGDLALAQGRRDDALAAFRQAVKAYPDRVPPMLALAGLLHEDGDTKGAAELVEQVEAIAPGNGDAELLRFRIMADRGEWAKIRSALLRREAALPVGSPLSLIYGEALLRLGHSEQARMLFTRSVLLAPGNPHTRLMLAEAQLATGDAPRAWETIAPLAAGTLAPPEVLDCALRVARQTGAPEAAGLAARLEPARIKATTAAVQAGEAALDRGDWPRAVAVYTRLLARGEDPEVLNLLASAETGMGSTAAAIAHADRAVALDADNSEYLYTAAMARVMADRDLATARRLLETAKAIAPDDASIQEALDMTKAAAAETGDGLFVTLR